MDNSSDFRTGRHVVSQLHAHLVFVTKYRNPVFSEAHLVRVEEIMREVCEGFSVVLVEFNGESNHVHLLVEYPAHVQLSRLVNSLKGVSSRLLRKEFPEVSVPFWGFRGLWSPSYFAGSVGGAPLGVVREYIENQNKPGDSPST